MKLPLSSWKTTLRKLGLRITTPVGQTKKHQGSTRRKRSSRQPESRYELLEPRQLLAGDAYFSVVDSWLDKSLQYSLDGDAQDVFSLGASRAPRGTAFSEDGQHQFVVDANKRIHIFDTETQKSVGSWRAMGLASPQGITVDGDDLLIVDQARDKVFRFEGATEHRSGRFWANDQFRLRRGNRWPSGIASDGDRIWVTDRWTDRVYVYGMQGEKLGNWRLDRSNRRPTGIAIDPGETNRLWVVDEQDNEVYVYENGRNLRSGLHRADEQLSLRWLNRFPQGIAVAPGNDTGVPTPPQINSIQDDTGPSDSDGVTSDNRFSIRGNSEPETDVLVRLEDGTELGSATTDTDGNWTIESNVNLDQGEFLLTAVASNSFGNSDPSPSFRVLIDSVAPVQPVILAVTEDRGSSDSDGITSDNTLLVNGTAEPFSQLELIEAQLGRLSTVEVDASGNWTVDLTGDALADGNYQLAAVAIDLAGNRSSQSNEFALQIDTNRPIAPSILSISDDRGRNTADGVTNQLTQTISGTADPSTRLRLLNDGLEIGTTTVGSDGTWSIPFNFTAGEHSLTAVSVDLAGNSSLPSQVFELVIDTTAPAAPTIDLISEDTQTQDGVTSDNQFSISGTAEPLAQIQFSESSLGNLGTAIADSSGFWSFQLASPLADGNYTFAASAEDIAGNQSDPSAAFSVVVDTVAPSSPSIAIVDQDTGASNSDGITSDTTLLFRGMAEAGSIVILQEAVLGELGSGVADENGNVSIDVTGLPFSDGTYLLTATATDIAGNQSAPSSEFSLVIDTQAPAVATIESITDDTGVNQDGVTSDDTLIVSGLAEPGTQVILSEATLGELDSVTATTDGLWSVDLTSTPLVNGTYQFSVRVVDLAGNTSLTSEVFEVVVDTDRPDAPSIALIEEDTGISGTDQITSDSTLRFRGMGPAEETVLVYEATLGLWGTAVADTSGVWELDATDQPLEEGTYSFYAIAEDLAGNASPESARLTVVVDLTAPSEPVIARFDNDTGSNSDDGITADSSPTLAGTAEANSEIIVEDSFLGELARGFADDQGEWQLQLSNLADGTYQLEATSIDVAGNVSSVSSSLTIQVDTVSPAAPSVVSITEDTGVSDQDAITQDSRLVIQGLGEAGATITLTESSIGLNASTLNEADGTWSIDLTNVELADAEYQFEAVATDLAGNVSDISSPLSVVVDRLAPSTPDVQLDPSFDTGVLGDLETSASEVTLVGTTEPGAIVTLGNGDQVDADTNGEFRFESISLSLGENLFTFVASDLAGNEATSQLTITRIEQVASPPSVIAGLLNDTGTSDGDDLTADPTITGRIIHPTNFSATLVVEYDGLNGRTTRRGEFTSRIQADGSFVLDPNFLSSLFTQEEPFTFGFYNYSIEAVDANDNSLVGYHFGEMLYVPSGSDSPPIAMNVGLLNDTGPIATDRLSTDPTLTGFVVGNNIQSVRFFYDSADQEISTEIVDRLDGNGEFVLDRSFLENLIGEPLGFQRHAYHVEVVDGDGNFAFKYNDFGFLESDQDDITAPVLSFSLTNDSGSESDDGITNDLSIAGSASDESPIVLTAILFDLNSFDEYEGDISDAVDAGGNFALSNSDWATIFGGAVPDGDYEITLVAEDRYSSTFQSLFVQLDRTTPGVPEIGAIVTDSGESDSDGITNDPTLAVQGTGDPGSIVQLFESGLGTLGRTTVDPQGSWQFEITGAGLVDGNYTFQAQAISLSGNQSLLSSSFQVTLDTDSPLRADFELAPAFVTGDPDDQYTTEPIVDLVGTTSPGANVILVHDGQATVADASGNFQFRDVTLNLGNHVYEVQTFDVAGNLQSSKRRVTLDQPVNLEDENYVSEVTRRLPRDRDAVGSQTIRFRIDADFAGGSTIEDSLQVYVVDPADGATVIDLGIPSTPAFLISGDRVQFRAGSVRFDGNYVEIDVTNVDLDEVELQFQLIDQDGNRGTQIAIQELGIYQQPNESSTPEGRASIEIDPGEPLDLGTLETSTDVEFRLAHVRFDSATGTYSAAMEVVNRGADLGRSIVASFDSLPSGVTLLNGSGVDANGDPYVNFADAIPSYGLLSGQASDPVILEFSAPTTSPFLSLPTLLDGGAPVAPVIDAVGTIEAMPGEVIEVQLSATDAQNAYFTMSNDGSLPDMTLLPDGRLTIAPKPGQLGNYQFDVFVTDGIRESSTTITLDVVADPDMTSRISGAVMDTFSNPLPGIPIELDGVTVNTDSEGKFELSFSGSIPNDALKIHGDAYVGPEVYPFVAEKLPLLLGHDAFDNINNVVVRPIYLPALDVANGVTIDPASDVTVTTSNIPGAAVFVAAGSLEAQGGGAFTGELSITEVPAEFTPAALPPDIFPDLVVTIQPGEMVFNTPAPLDLPNLSGFPAGTEMILWSINPITGLFDNVGTGVVSADETVIQTVEGGIRNSSWHMFSATGNAQISANENPHNEEKDCDPCSERRSPDQSIPEDTPFWNENDFRKDNSQRSTGSDRSTGSKPRTGQQTGGQNFGRQLRNNRNGASTTLTSRSGGTTQAGAGFGSGWGTGGQMVLGSKGDFGPYGSWDFTPKPTFTFGFNTVPDAQPIADVATDINQDTQVSLHSGALHKSHSLVNYQSLNQWRGLELHYDSERADARPIFNVSMDGIPRTGQRTLVTKVTVSRGTMQMVVPGFQGTAPGLTGGEHFFSIPDETTSLEASVQADLNHLPSGVYTYETASRVARGTQFSGRSTSTSDQFIHVNASDSEFGIGWGLAGLTRLIENPDGSVLLIDGDGGERLFQAPQVAGEPYIAPADDFTVLEKLNGRFRRTHTNQLVESYSSTHRLSIITDRNGNQTQFLYNGEDKLESIVDPVGLVTQFRYTDGHVTEIEDPAGRITRLEYQQGNLTRIEDPDQSSKAYQYDSANRLVEETDKQGSVERIEVGFSGRVESIQRRDGSRVEYAPVQTLNLSRPELSSSPTGGATTGQFRNDAVSDATDANGNVTRVVVDKGGQLLNSFDGQGGMPQVDRDDNNLVQRMVDGRGNETVLEYDDRGNVIRVSDSIARGPQSTIPFGETLQSVATFDADNDGFLDLIVTMPEFDAIGVAFGDGGGNFSQPVEFDAGFVPTELIVADWNGDSYQDLAVTNQEDQLVTILFNDGAGGFDIGAEVSVISPTNGVAVDVDNDGQTDIVVGGFAQYTVLINNGDETFTPTTVDLASATGFNRVAVGDFDSDNNVDLVIGAPEFVLFTNQLEIHTGAGDGSFNLATTIDVGGGTDDGSIAWELTDVTVADMDGDGWQDIVATTPYTNEAITTNLSVTFGNGDGSFSSPLGLLAGEAPVALATIDLNQDGQLEILVANAGSDRVSMIENLTDREFRGAIDYESKSGPTSLSVGDFDGDGRQDFAVANQVAGEVAIFSPSTDGKRFEYDPIFNQLTRTVDELGREVLYEIDTNNGNTLSITQVFGSVGGGDDLVTSFTYSPEGLIESETDPLGRITEHEYNEFGLLIRTTYAVGTSEEASVRYEYDAAGNRTAFENELGHRAEYVFDAMNRVTQIMEADPDGAGPLESPVTTNEYDAQGNLIRTVDAEGQATEFVFDAQHRLVETIDADQHSTFHEYDASGNLVATIDRLSRRTEFVYDQRNRLSQVINAEGGRIVYRYDADDNRIVMIDELGVQTNYEYDARNRMIAEVNALGGVTTFEYDRVDNLVAITDELGRRTEREYDEINRLVLERGPDPDRSGPALSPEIQYVYDKASNLVSTVDPLGNETARVFDNRDRMVQFTEADPDGTGPLASPVTINEYDDANRLTRSVDPLGREVQLVYDELSRLIQEIHPDPDGSGPQTSPVVQYSYDQVDNRLTSIDALGNITRFSYDNLHRSTIITAPDPDGAGPALAPVVTTVYDAEGQVIQKVDPLGRATNYEYDDLGHVIRTTLPDPDGVGPLVAPVMTYQYDLVGNETESVDALGNRTTHEYDDLYRLVKIIEEDPDGEAGPALRPTTRFRYDAAHQLVASTDALNRTTRFEYDDLGRLVKEIYPDPDGEGTDQSPVITHEFDLIGNRLATIDALGNRTDFVYDNQYRLVQTIEADPDGAGPDERPITTQEYDAASQLVVTTDPLGRTSRYVYDNLGRVIQRQLPDPDGTGPQQIPVYSFTYDLVGNPLTSTDALGNTTITVYDNLYRAVQVIEADPDGSGPQLTPVTTYSFDVASQLTSITDALGRVTSMQYDALGRRIQMTRPDPDGPGSQTSPVRSYSFDSMDNLIAETDAEGNTTAYVLDNLYRTVQVVSPDPDDGGPQQRPTRSYEFDLEDQLIASIDPLGRRTELTYDDLGRVTQRVLPDPDDSGPLLSPLYSYSYDLMGNRLAETDAVGNQTRYEYDSLYRRVRVIEADPDGAGPKSNPTSEFQFDLAGQLLASADELGRTTEFQYDDLGRVIRKIQPDPDGNGPLSSPEFVYSYDLMNNKLEEIDPLGFQMNYEYDNLYRMVRELGEDLDGAGPLGRPETRFTYDLEDNRTSITDSSGNRTEFAFDDLDRVFEETIELGPGNEVSRTFEYDQEDHLVRKPIGMVA